MVRVPGKDSLALWRQTKTTLRGVCVLFLKGPSHDGPSFPKLPTSVHSGLFPAASSLKPDQIFTWRLGLLRSVQPCCSVLKWHSTGILVFVHLSQTSLLLITHIVVCLFCFFLPLYFPKSPVIQTACVPHFYPEMMKISNQPILSLFTSKSAVALAAGYMKCITCCAVEMNFLQETWVCSQHRI